jgi:hypothetical protein
MVTVVATLQQDRALLVLSQIGFGSLLIEHAFISRSSGFTAGENEILVGSSIDLEPCEHKYLDITDSLLELFGDGPLVSDIVWVTVIVPPHPSDGPTACLTIEIYNSRIIGFKPLQRSA